jgi:hypothetical protein
MKVGGKSKSLNSPQLSCVFGPTVSWVILKHRAVVFLILHQSLFDRFCFLG